MENTSFCPICKFEIQNSWFFCPNCAKELKEKVPIISISKQIFVYFVSFFFSPLGLVWGIKYARSRDRKVKIIGIIAIILNIIAIVLMIIASKNFIEQYTKTINDLVPSY
ncbi:conserved hypothetical protein [Candidatus Roizmanbacteria bacterium]|nr:conserved hypothetical protein [Candidatus Roizmanbacteria bacterium]